MKKDEFIDLLDKKLQVINEKERKDIIDEYRTHIEMKMRDGKTEEEAIEDFGDIDELVDDILDAYKINTNRVHEHSFDRKFNNFMDELFEGFKRFIASFTTLEADDVIKLIFEFFIILIFLFIVRIPFEILSSLGASLLRSIVGLGIGHVLAMIWKIMINLVYIAIFIITLIDLFRKRIYRYRGKNSSDNTVFDDFKSTMHEFASGKNTYRKRNKSIYDEKDDVNYEESEATSANDPQAESVEEEPTEENQYYQHKEYYRRDDSYYVKDTVGGVARTLMRIFFCLIMIPFVAILIGLSCAIGALLILSFEGFTLFGSYFMLIGAIIVTSAFLNALYRLLWRGGHHI